MLRQLWHTYQAILKTGVLGKYPWWSIILFLACFLRHKASLYTLVVWSSLRFPERIAVAEPQQAATYKTLLQNSNKLALVLEQSFNLQSKQTVGLLCKNRMVLVEVLLACAKLKINVVLLNTLALDYLETLDLLICDEDYKAIINYHQQDKARLKIVYTPQLISLQESVWQTTSKTVWENWLKPASRLILLSSGTTGKPKVVTQHSKFYQQLSIASGLLEQLQLKAGTPTLLTTPLAHGQGMATLAFCLGIAAPLYISPQVDAQLLLKVIEEDKINVIVVVPTILYRLLECLRTTKTNVSSLQMILCGSAPLNPDLATRCLNNFGPVLYNLYGTSETGVISLATPQDLIASPDSVGQILKGLNVNIDKETHEIQLCNQHGQIIWHTGDAGVIDKQGRLFVHGRLDEMLICGGRNIYPQLLEDKLCQALPYILESAIVGIPDSEYGHALHYFVVLDSLDLTQEQLIEDIHKLMPKSLRPLRLSLLSELPKNQLGKIKRYALSPSQNTQRPPHA